MLVVLAHPSADSLNAALARTAALAAEERGVTTMLHDLYSDGFDPRLKARELAAPDFADDLTASYAHDLLLADALVIVHPVWFFQVPAVLKGWVDRVVREDVAFAIDDLGKVTGLLSAKSALVITTGNSSLEVERAAFGDPVTRFWRDVVLGPAGVARVERLAFTPVRDSTPAIRSKWLRAVAETVVSLVAPAADGFNKPP